MSGFKVFSSGKDLDALFQPRIASDPSAQLVPFVTPAGQNLSERYLPYTSGTKAVTTGFKFFDTSGNIQDLSDYYSKLLSLEWFALGGGAESTVNAIYALNASNIYVGGNFASVYSSGTIPVAETSRIAKWNGSGWSALGGGVSGTTGTSVRAIYALDASNIYVGGEFTSVYSSGTIPVTGTAFIAKWNGSSWSALGRGVGGVTSPAVNAIYALDASNVYVGGSFNTVYDASGNSVARTANIAIWNANNSSWSPVGRGTNDIVFAIHALDASNIYVGGRFSTVFAVGGAGIGAVRIAKWNANSSSWSTLGGGAQNFVRAIGALDASNVYVGGQFNSVYSSGTIPVDNTDFIARWNANTSTWSALGGGANSIVFAIRALDASNIYVGGVFTSVYDASGNSDEARSIAKWDGSVWSALSTGANNPVQSIYALDASNIYVGGQFTRTDASYNHIAKWGYS